jgi:hypothetical protein
MSANLPTQPYGDQPNVWLRLKHLCDLDLEALARWRVCAGVLLLVDLAWRAVDWAALYAADGMVSPRALRQLALPVLANLPSHSLHHVHPAPAWQAALWLIAAGAAVALTLGWRTRAACVVSWVLLTSLHAANPLVLNRGDAALRLLLMWSCFLPLGARWSFDARDVNQRSSRREDMERSDMSGRRAAQPMIQRSSRREDMERSDMSGRRAAQPMIQQASGFACVALTVQWTLLYFASLLHKSGPAWREDGLAVYYALQLDDFTTALGAQLAQHLWRLPDLSWSLTSATLAVELIAPLLLWCPWRRVQARRAAVLLGVALHLGFGATMRLDLFSPIMIAGWLIFWPSAQKGRSAQPLPVSMSWPVRSLLAALLASVILWNVWDVRGPQEAPRPMQEALRPVMRAAGLAQRWSMFSPEPARDDGWLAITIYRPGALEQPIDLTTGQPPSDDPPADRRAYNLRWRMIQMQLVRDDQGLLRQSYLGWLCKTHRGQFESIDLTFHQEYTMPPGEPPILGAHLLAQHRCDGAPP